MSFKCPDCGRKLKCYDTRPISKILTLKHYFCLACELVFMSIETLDTDGYRKRNYKREDK